MLFRKKIDPYCAYCALGARISEDEIMCIKHGIVAPAYHCRSFQYEPLKRVPPPPPRLTPKQTQGDFSLLDDPDENT